MRSIEDQFVRQASHLPRGPLPCVKFRARAHTPFTEVTRAMFRIYPSRTAVGLSLMASQAMLYNVCFSPMR